MEVSLNYTVSKKVSFDLSENDLKDLKKYGKHSDTYKYLVSSLSNNEPLNSGNLEIYGIVYPGQHFVEGDEYAQLSNIGDEGMRVYLEL